MPKHPYKVTCFITGESRPNTPEEKVRQAVARSLVEDYGYPKKDISIEFPVKMGTARKRVDVVIFHHGRPHKQEHVFILVELKRADARRQTRFEGVEQVNSYFAACLNAKFGWWGVGSERKILEKVVEEASSSFRVIPNLPPFGAALEQAHPYYSATVRNVTYIRRRWISDLLWGSVGDASTSGDWSLDVYRSQMRAVLESGEYEETLSEITRAFPDFSHYDRAVLESFGGFSDDPVGISIIQLHCTITIMNRGSEPGRFMPLDSSGELEGTIG